MLAIRFDEFNEFGCPNCGCDYAVQDSAYRMDQPGCTCKSCNLHFQLLAAGAKPETKFSSNRKDDKGEFIMECAIHIPHPRKGIAKWKWEAPDERPENGEYCVSRGVGYDLACFVRSRKAGLRILQMVHEVLGLIKPGKDYTQIPTEEWATAKSWLDYRDFERARIQFKFNPAEFDIVKLDKMIEIDSIVTKKMLEQCVLGGTKK